MAGLPRKYAKMGFKKGWAAYRKKRKAPKTSKKRTAKKASPMVRRRGRARRAVRRFARARSKTIPVVDVLHGVYTLDGMSNNAASQTVKNVASILTGPSSLSTKSIETSVKNGVTYAVDHPKEAVLGGVKNFAVGYLLRKGAGLFLPRSVKLFGKWRIQVR